MRTRKPYALYRNPPSCDITDWGRPSKRFATLAEALAGSGHPDPLLWWADEGTPDEIGCWPRPTPVILAAGVARELLALQAAQKASTS